MNNNSISQAEFVQEFISAVIKHFFNDNQITIDIVSITIAMRDIKFDMEGPICSDHKLMQIFKNGDYLHIYNSDDLLYDKVFNVCYDYVKNCDQLLINKNK